MMCLRKLNGMRIGDILSMKNAFLGYGKGLFTDVIWKRIWEDWRRYMSPWIIVPSFYVGNRGDGHWKGAAGVLS